MSSTKWWSIDSWRRLPKKFLSSPAPSPGCNFHTCLSEKETHYPWPWKLSIQVLAQSSRHVTFIYSFWCCAICKSLKDHQCLPIFLFSFIFYFYIICNYSLFPKTFLCLSRFAITFFKSAIRKKLYDVASRF